MTTMEIGVVFPQTELGGDRGAVRAYAQATADLGFSHVATYEHVLGAEVWEARGQLGAQGVPAGRHSDIRNGRHSQKHARHSGNENVGRGDTGRIHAALSSTVTLVAPVSRRSATGN